MEAWGIKARQTVEGKEPVGLGDSVVMVTKKHDVDAWLIVVGADAGLFAKEFDSDCLIIRNEVLNKAKEAADMALADGAIKSFDIIKFNLTEVGVDNETWKKLKG